MANRSTRDLMQGSRGIEVRPTAPKVAPKAPTPAPRVPVRTGPRVNPGRAPVAAAPPQVTAGKTPTGATVNSGNKAVNAPATAPRPPLQTTRAPIGTQPAPTPVAPIERMPPPTGLIPNQAPATAQPQPMNPGETLSATPAPNTLLR